MASPQALSLEERRTAAAWAADCAERAVHCLRLKHRTMIECLILSVGARSVREKLDAAGEIRRRFEADRGAFSHLAGGSSRGSVGRARAAVAHMAARHRCGRVCRLCEGEPPRQQTLVRSRPSFAGSAYTWIGRPATRYGNFRRSERTLPGPLGHGLLARGQLGSIVKRLPRALRHTGGIQHLCGRPLTLRPTRMLMRVTARRRG